MMTDLLDPGEVALWTGGPAPLRYAVDNSLATFLFGIPVFGFTVVWARSAAIDGGDAFNVPIWMFAIPVLLGAAAMLLSPAWHFWRAKNTVYILTARRALMAITGPWARRVSVPLSEIKFIDARPTRGGGASIFFKETATNEGQAGTVVVREGFVAIADVAHVEQLMRQVIDRNAAPRVERAAS